MSGPGPMRDPLYLCARRLILERLALRPIFIMPQRNQNPEQLARDKIDALLEQSGWKVQDNKRIDFNAGPGIAVREYPTDVGPADYVLFVDQRTVGVIEAKPEEWGHKITTAEEQSGGYAAAKFKRVNNTPAGRAMLVYFPVAFAGS